MAGANHAHRNLPFLHRNWMTAINSWQAMGVKFSTPTGNPGDSFRDSGHDLCSRPAKRRRLGDASPDASAFRQDCDGYCLPEQPGPLQRALRIEVLKLIHKDSARVRFNGIFNGLIPPAVKDVETSKARCRITIYCEKAGAPLLLHCDSQLCDVKSFKNPVGPSRMARVYLPQPFTVPEDKIYVERDDDETFGIADAYTVLVELESAGHADWPPLSLASPYGDADIFSKRSAPPRHWVLSAHVADLFRRSRPRIPLMLKKGPQHDVMTDFVVDVDVRWTTGFSDKLVSRRLEKGVLPSIVAIDPDEKLPAVLDGHVNGYLTNDHHLLNGYVNGVNGLSEDEDAEGELTPNRSLRTRESKNYNLKDLSDKAQGKERRRRRKLEKWEQAGEDCKVTYNIPAEQVVLDGMQCCVCGAATQSMSQLRVHFLSHSQYSFTLEQRAGRGANTVTIAHDDKAPGSPLRPRVYQLGRATRPLDLDKLADGDDSWITSRHGPENDTTAKRPQARVPQKLGARRRDAKVVVVPNTKQPLYDALSKAQLEPGSEVRRVIADDRWLSHKHREVVQDYSDVSGTEKEYIREWDSFIIGKRISSDAYLPRTVVAFARERGPWLVAAPQRVEEFGKHLSVLVAKGALDDDGLNETLACVAEARNQLKEGPAAPKPSLSPKEAAYRSSGGCAVCRLPVLGPSLLVCANKGCAKRLYHDDCITAAAKIPIDSATWFCNSCVSAGCHEEQSRLGRQPNGGEITPGRARTKGT